MEKIEIKNINFSHDDKKLFVDFSASYPARKRGIIMGTSGCGKTTLLHILAGLVNVSGGEIEYPMEKPKFSMVFQEDRLIDSLNVVSNIKLVNDSLDDDEIKECLGQLNIAECMNEKVWSLSGGQKRRVSIARAILAEYDILLLDEPLTGIDDENKMRIIDYIKGKTEGKTVLMVTHDKVEADAMGGEIYYM